MNRGGRTWVWLLLVSTTALGQVKPCETCWTEACPGLKAVVKKCPAGASAAVPACPAGQVRTGETAGNCCWPGQVWSTGKKRCVGVPDCPAGTTASGEACVAAATPAPTTSEPAAVAQPSGKCPKGMAWIPGGSFKLGETQAEATVEGFCLDVTEVTVAAYSRRATLNTGSGCNEADKASHPVNCVDWNEATAYCEAVGKRLPTEEEWEWAARGGVKGWQYPWGNSAPGNKACWDGPGNSAGEGNRQDTCPVGAFRAGANPQGVQDLAGNVWEWTSSNYEANSPARVVRGGSWLNSAPEFLRASYRFRYSPSCRYDNLGFRCARTL